MGRPPFCSHKKGALKERPFFYCLLAFIKLQPVLPEQQPLAYDHVLHQQQELS